MSVNNNLVQLRNTTGSTISLGSLNIGAGVTTDIWDTVNYNQTTADNFRQVLVGIAVFNEKIGDGSLVYVLNSVDQSSANAFANFSTLYESFQSEDNLEGQFAVLKFTGNSVTGLTGQLTSPQKVTVRKNTGADVGSRPRLNFIEGTNVSISIADDSGNDELDITITSSGGAGGGDVTGPASSTDNALVRFDGTSGKIIKNSGITVDASNNVSGINDLSVGGNITVTGTVDGVDVSGHASRHNDGGADEISLTGLSGLAADPQKVTVRKNSGADVGSRTRLNFIEGSSISITASDDAGGGEIDLTISSTINLDGYALKTTTITAGAGLTGGGDLSANRTINVAANADGSIVVNADDIQVGVLATDAQHGNRGGGSLHTAVSNTAAGFVPTVGSSGTILNSTGTASQWSTSAALGLVSGPGSATDRAIAIYSGTGGKTVQNSAVTVTAGGIISNVTDPAAAQDAATKNYVDTVPSIASNWKQAVKAATTANITLSGTQTIDGISIVATDRVLVKNQSTQSENGIYICSAGAWSRATDATTASQIQDMVVAVQQGTANADTVWKCTTDPTITVGSTNIVFSPLAISSTAPSDVTKAAASAGTSPYYARIDHKHDITTASAVALTVGGSNAEGTATTVARSDHTHSLPAFGSSAGTFTQGNDARLSDDRTASGIRTATTIVAVSSATAPSSGQAIVATSSTAATWQSVALSATTITAGAGLTGGGDLSTNRTINVAANADGSIVVNADDIQVGVLATDAQHGNRGGGSLHSAVSNTANGFVPAVGSSGTIFNSTGTAGQWSTSSALGLVSGPGSATDRAIAIYSGTGGKTVQNSAVTVTAGGIISNVTDPVASSDAATKNYVDTTPSIASNWKQAVKLATTANITLSGTQTIDGASAAALDRILVKNQSTQSENGIYICSAGAWSRATDATTAAQIQDMIVPVQQGTANADTVWKCTTDPTITVGSTNIIFNSLNISSTAPSDVTKAAASAGTSPYAARIDHKHDISTAAPSTALTGASTNTEGSATSLARSDHTHSIVGLLTSNAPTQITVTTASAGVATSAAREDHTHSVSTAGPTALTVGGSNVTGTASSLSRSDHVHSLPAFGTTAGTFAQGNDARFIPVGTLDGYALTSSLKYQTVQSGGSNMTQRGKLNFIQGTNVTLSIVDDSGNDRTNVTISATGGGGGSQTLGQTLALGNTTDGYDVIFTGSSRRVITNNQASSNTAGDSFTIQTGTGNGTGAGGAIAVTGGQGGATGNGGALTLTAGAGGATSGTGGALTLVAGAGTSSTAAGGAISITSGAGGATSGASGAVTLASGNTVGTASGSVTIKSGTSSGSTTGFVNIQSGNTLGLAIDANTNFTSATDRQVLSKSTSTSSLQYISLLSTDIAPVNNDQSGTTYTLLLSDAGKTIRTTHNAGSVTVTVPLNSSVAFPVGTQIYVTQIGTSGVTIAATGGVTLNTLSNKTLVLAERYATVILVKTDTNTWIVDGENAYSTAVGDVVGPAGASDTAIARFNGTTGKLIQNSGVLIDASNNITGVTALTMSGVFTVTNNVTVSGNITVSGTVDGVDVSGHASRHNDGGADEISLTGLSGLAADPQKVTVRKNTGSDVGSRPRLNFIEGSNVTITVADDSGSNEVDITIASTGGGGGGGGSQTLFQTLALGNTTDGYDVIFTGSSRRIITNNQVASNTDGDSLTILTGNGNGTGGGGDILLTAGNGGGTGVGGDIQIKSGTGTADGYISIMSGNTTAAYFNNATNYTAASSRQVLAKGTSSLEYISLLSTDISNVNNDQSGTTYTLVLGDAGKTVRFTHNSGSVALTVPANATVAYPVGTIVYLTQVGSSTVTVAGAGGVTVSTLTGKTLSFAGQYAQCMLVKIDTNQWILTGENLSSTPILTYGNSTVDFGSTESDLASITVTGQTAITANSIIHLYIYGSDTTSDHNADEHIMVSQFLTLVPSAIVPGTGFTINAVSSTGLTGTYKVRWSYQ